MTSAPGAATGYTAAVLSANRSFEIRRIQRPTVQSHEVLTRVRATNVCATDVKKWDNPGVLAALAGRPLILGHEIAAEVIEVGAAVSMLRPGDRIAIDPVIRPPLSVEYGATGSDDLLGVGAAAGSPAANGELFVRHGIGGGFAELLKIPAACAIPLPEEVSFEEGSLVEPLADVVHSVEAAGDVAGAQCAVYGLGPMGLLHVVLLVSLGAKVTGVDLRPDRRALSVSLGANAAVGPDEPGSFNNVFIAVGGAGFLPACSAALDRLEPGGTLVAFSSAPSGASLTLDVNRLHYRNQRLVGVVGFDRSHADLALEHLSDHLLDVEILRRPHFSLPQIQKAFEECQSPGAVKVAIDLP